MTLAAGPSALLEFPAQHGWHVAAASRTGARRDANEDRWLVVPADEQRPLLVAVADGVGGEAAGERASAAALEMLERRWRAWQPQRIPSDGAVRQTLLDAARDADLAVRALVNADPKFARAATTFTAAAVSQHGAVVVHAGDSRAYFVAAHGARQLTADHTWVAEQIANRKLTPADAERHPMRHVITRCLGIPGDCAFDAFAATRRAGESLLLCTDGVSNMVNDAELAGTAPSAVATVDRIMGLVAARDGSDDATLVVAVPVEAVATDPFHLRRALDVPSRRQRVARRVALTGVGLAVAGTAAVLGVPRAQRALQGLFRTPPEPAAQDYLTTWQQGQFAALYAYLSARARQLIDQDGFVRRHEAVLAEMTATRTVVSLTPEHPEVRLNDRDITLPFDVTYTTTRFGEIRRSNQLPLRWEDRGWHVDWTPAVLLPELTNGRLVRAIPQPGVRGSILDRQGKPLAVSQGPADQPDQQARAYPQGALAGPLVGYLGEVTSEELQQSPDAGYVPGDTVGRAGVEAAAEPTLAGKRGGRLTVVEPSGQVAATLSGVPPVSGENVTLTLDLALQAEAEAALGSRPGSVIVIDPRDGAIRALATYPRYDPGAFASGGAAAILNDPGQPLLNRPLQGLYPPGSIFKVVTMSAALERGAFTPDSEFVCTGRWTGLPGVQQDCWLKTGHGRLNLVSGLTQSCDVVFYELGKRLDEIDQDYLPGFAARCGLGAAPKVLPGHEQAGVVPGPDWKRRVQGQPWTRGDAVNMAIGQGQLLVSPLQMASIYTSIAAGPQSRPMRLLDRATQAGGNIERTLAAAQALKLPWSSQTLDAVRAGLNGVVGAPDGTAAFVFQGSPLAAVTAGKTGTAETVPGRNTHAWFACYAPIGAPEAVVLTMLEYAGEGSVVAAPLARRVLEAALGQ